VADFRVLSGSDGHAAPADLTCLACGRALVQDGCYLSAYMSGGAMLMSQDGRTGHESDRLQGFLAFGVLTDRDGGRGSAEMMVVEQLKGGQFAIQWCSVGCMRDWLLGLLAEVERRASNAGDADTGAAPDLGSV
jgi:hypothetical protein